MFFMDSGLIASNKFHITVPNEMLLWIQSLIAFNITKH